jgi:uncharacterized membrane protein YphA (DoxX/SURF4 family)
MPPRSLVRTFVLLWWTLGLALLVGSIQTVRAPLDSSGHPNPHLVLLGSIEAVAALLFLIPRTLRLGASGLLLTLAVALLVHAGMHQLRWDLLVDAAAVLFVAVHGPVPTTRRTTPQAGCSG